MSRESWKPNLQRVKETLLKLKESGKNFSKLSDLKNTDSKSVDSYKQNIKELAKLSKKIPSDVKKKYPVFPWKYVPELAKNIDKPLSKKSFEKDWQNFHDSLSSLGSEIDNIIKKYNETAHEWKICPIGEYFVRGSHVDNYTTGSGKSVKEHLRRQHCREYSKHHNVNILSLSEVKAINDFFISKEFKNIKLMNFDKKEGAYDSRIAGWVSFWNDILKPSIPLDPNFMKALIDSESTFDPNANRNYKGKDPNRVGRGIGQITPNTAKILMGKGNELKDHFIDIDGDKLYDPDLGLAAGVRWIYRKKDFASSKLKREATWLEAVEAYKGVLLLEKDSKIYKFNMGPFLKKIKKIENKK